ncbi:sugar phosphate isomerase/epimerase family protein [Aspergillus ruber CBS 135680]|uniref:Xylose isomerase-like protein n=1 Tax=Aspergillus ruber (strain CBS 135680) TaxID=1388766 RepID=A0A017S527_ASPRC|nr:xylose isomerase-like protein [Aspergillus ruber CBS 135680]EYE92113.1 xylose isomerase-like protein [Aspergillus ruber CBS 135680]
MVPNKIAIATVSLGQHATHRLDQKILAAAQHGFAGIELVYSDLSAYAEKNKLSMSTAAETIKGLCAKHKLAIVSLAPFENFEGSTTPLEKRLEIAQHWIRIARNLGALYLQIPSHYKADEDESAGDEALRISDLQKLADIGSAEQPIVSIAYEALSWGTHYSTWEDSLYVVEKVNRSNFGLCLDNFHVITKLWASAFRPSGKLPNADNDLAQSLYRFRDHCPLDKIFYLQFSDGELFDPPFSDKHPWYLQGEAPEFTWSKHARPFPLESELGGYMPVVDIARTWIVESGFEGWVSLEVFDRRMRDEGFSVDTAARRGIESWRKVKAELEVPQET